MFSSISTKKIVFYLSEKKVEIDTDLSLSHSQNYSDDKAQIGQNIGSIENTSPA